MDKAYRVVVESSSETLASVEDPLDGEKFIIPGNDQVAFEVQGKEKFDRLTPILFELDAREDFVVTVDEL